MFADLDEVRLGGEHSAVLMWDGERWRVRLDLFRNGTFPLSAGHNGTPGESAGAVVRHALAQLELLQHNSTEGK